MPVRLAQLSLVCHQNEYIFAGRLRLLSEPRFLGFSGFSGFAYGGFGYAQPPPLLLIDTSLPLIERSRNERAFHLQNGDKT